MKFGDWVKQQRHGEGRTQADVAVEAGVSQTVIARVENPKSGKQGVSLRYAECITFCFGYTLAQALTEIEAHNKKKFLTAINERKSRSLIGE